MQANIYVILGLYFYSTYILTINAPLILILREVIFLCGQKTKSSIMYIMRFASIQKILSQTI